jgi:hypothetical protein
MNSLVVGRGANNSSGVNLYYCNFEYYYNKPNFYLFNYLNSICPLISPPALTGVWILK